MAVVGSMPCNHCFRGLTVTMAAESEGKELWEKEGEADVTSWLWSALFDAFDQRAAASSALLCFRTLCEEQNAEIV